MIESETEYFKAREEIDQLNEWIGKLEKVPDGERQNITLASVRRMLSRVLEEVADYEQSLSLNEKLNIKDEKSSSKKS